jgi:hypothetical protein
LEDIIGRLGLTLSAEKTRTVDAADGFDFLGMHFRLQPMRSNPKRLFCYRWPSTKAMRTIRHKVRDAVGYDDIYSLEEKIRALNPILRGWGQYFRIGNAHRHFKKVDSYVYTKPVNSCGGSTNGVARDSGHSLPPSSRRRGCTISTARWCIASARHAVNTVGKPDDRNGPVRFDEGALETE